MRILRCGCGLLSALSLLPIVLLLAGALVAFNDPHALPGPLGDFAASVRGGLAQVALGGDLGSGGLSVKSVDYDATGGGTLTVTLSTTATKAPASKDLEPAFKTLGGHLSGPLQLADGVVVTVALDIVRASDGRHLASFRAKASDLVAYAAGDISSGTLLKRVSTP